MYDLAIIGAGWAGFNAALEAKKLGLKTVLIEKDKIGGTCLNRGCIPTKTLIHSAKVYSLIKKSSKFGIESSAVKINFPEIQNRKQAVVNQLAKGMQFMLKGVEFLQGEARFISNEDLVVADNRIKAKYIIIATGSSPIQLPGLRFDNKKIISSKSLLDSDKIPESLLIIGGGVIGCEFACLFATLGTKVTIVELMPQLLPQEDKEIARKIETIFKKKGVEINTNTDAKKIDLNNFELVLLSIGRSPDFQGLDLEKTGIKISKNRICTDEHMRTNISNIYAAGDCTGGKLLAHFASHQGIVAVKNIVNPGAASKIEDSLVPGCIFTDPEISSIGITEEQAKNKNMEIKINKFDFLGSGMARILDETEGFVKVISDKKTGDLLGGSIIGPKATELIGILTVAIQSRLKLSQLQKTLFAHPALSEAIHESVKD